MRIILDFYNGAVRVSDIQNPIGNWSRVEGVEVCDGDELECLKALVGKLSARIGYWNVPLKKIEFEPFMVEAK